MRKYLALDTIGTSNLSIGVCEKMGTSSLTDLLQQDGFSEKKILLYHGYVDEIANWNEDKNIVILIRDVIDKWRSGYKEELWEEIKRRYVQFKEDESGTTLWWEQVGGRFPEIMKNLHDINNDVTWMVRDHAKFWKWNDEYDQGSLWELMLEPNIYFLKLKDLSNPKFLKWLQEKDEKWKIVREIIHENSSKNLWPESLMNEFWKEHENDDKLVCPFYDLESNKFEILYEIVKQQQEVVNYIRKNHERYIRL
jgi:hypothetical protein